VLLVLDLLLGWQIIIHFPVSSYSVIISRFINHSSLETILKMLLFFLLCFKPYIRHNAPTSIHFKSSDIHLTLVLLDTLRETTRLFLNLFKVILYSYLILKKMNERITDS